MFICFEKTDFIDLVAWITSAGAVIGSFREFGLWSLAGVFMLLAVWLDARKQFRPLP